MASLRRPADSRVRLPDLHHPRENRFFCPPLQHSCFQSQMKLGAAAAAKSLQSCPTLCDPVDSSPPGSSIPGILQARILEWVAISFSKIGRVGFNIHSTENLSPSPNSSYYISIYVCKIKFLVRKLKQESRSFGFQSCLHQCFATVALGNLQETASLLRQLHHTDKRMKETMSEKSLRFLLN